MDVSEKEKKTNTENTPSEQNTRKYIKEEQRETVLSPTSFFLVNHMKVERHERRNKQEAKRNVSGICATKREQWEGHSLLLTTMRATIKRRIFGNYQYYH